MNTRSFIQTLLLASAMSVALPAVAESEEEVDMEAELSDDQSQVQPAGALTLEQMEALKGQVLPTITLAPKSSPESVDMGALCKSEFSQRSPICAQKR